MTAIHFSHFEQHIEMFLTNFAHVIQIILDGSIFRKFYLYRNITVCVYDNFESILLTMYFIECNPSRVAECC